MRERAGRLRTAAKALRTEAEAALAALGPELNGRGQAAKGAGDLAVEVVACSALQALHGVRDAAVAADLMAEGLAGGADALARLLDNVCDAGGIPGDAGNGDEDEEDA
jgi:hypothetical protein